MQTIPPEMRRRLLRNRQGRLTAEQYKDMVTEPLAVLVLLLAPAIIILGPRLFAFSLRGLVYVALIVILVIVLPIIFRAIRYSRAPVHFEQLYAGASPMPRLFFWQALTLYTKTGQPVRFKKRLAPGPRLRANHAYDVYYLRDPKAYVLLSMAPADHPEAESWQPGEAFYQRFERRS